MFEIEQNRLWKCFLESYKNALKMFCVGVFVLTI